MFLLLETLRSVFRIFFLIAFIRFASLENECSSDVKSCEINQQKSEEKYSKAANKNSQTFITAVQEALDQYQPCKQSSNCSCYSDVIDNDLEPFQSNGITRNIFEYAIGKGIKYQIINGKLYRQKECNFPARCAGVEHYLLELAESVPDMELIVNVRDWPQVNMKWNHQQAPVFSFSKTKDYSDIMYPAWSFWEGGPAIKLYPTGLGKWHLHRKLLNAASEKWPWDRKQPLAFFRGSRTSNERDAIVLLSRSNPDIADAQYTKNQAWKSDADTLHAAPASEVSLEDHCKYKYLLNYRGVAASFRFKHLFLCKSLVFHVGDEWLEFFYPSLKPWVHYVPIIPTATKEELRDLIEFFINHDDLAKEIAERGFDHIWHNLRIKEVKCYWKRLLKSYSKLVKYKVERDENLIIVKD